jgi:hypothetical protein
VQRHEHRRALREDEQPARALPDQSIVETAGHEPPQAVEILEFDAYSSDRQLVLSTQAPQVVSWADPLSVRLVERRSSHTEVRRLQDSEIARLSVYLHDDGTLGDYVYSGALDG